jgi:hypothetical protein
LPSAAAIALCCLLEAPVAAPGPAIAAGAPPGAPAGASSPTPAAGSDAAPRRRLLPIAAALVPGLLVHGSGHFAAGDRETARQLLATESVGLAMLVGSIGGLSFTGASRKFVAPFVLLGGAGLGTMTVTALSDLYGVLAPGAGWGGPERPVATTVRLGSLYVRNPTMPYRWITGAALESWSGGLRVEPAFYSNLDGRTLRAELRAGYRLVGARPTDPFPSARQVDASVGLFHHRERRTPGEYDMTVGDVMASGRFGLGGWLPTLTGAFVEWGAGAAIGAYHYGGVGAIESSDALLMRFGFGVHFGAPGAPRRGELLLLYDHRHDGFAGGMKIIGLGSGAFGHIGMESHVMFTRRWGLGLELAAGSAHLAGLWLRWQPSEPRS